MKTSKPANRPQNNAPKTLSTAAILAVDQPGFSFAIRPVGLHRGKPFETVAFTEPAAGTESRVSWALLLSTVALVFHAIRFCFSATVGRSCRNRRKSDSKAAAET